MEKEFSLYLTKIGLIDKTTFSSLIRNYEVSADKSFTDSSFYFLMNYFDNLNDEKKKYMSYYIPIKFKLISEEIKKTKIKSIIIQLILRQKLIKLKYFYLWKKNINLFDNNFNKYISYIKNTKNENEIFFEQNRTINKNNFNKNKDNEFLDNELYENGNNIEIPYENIDEFSIENIDNLDKRHYKNSEDEQLNKLNMLIKNSLRFNNYMKNNKNNNNNNIKYNLNRNKDKNQLSKIKKQNYNTIYINSFSPKKRIIINQINSAKKNSYKNINQNNFRKQKIQKKNYSANNTRRNNNKTPIVYTSLEQKEMKELEECTFKPKINKSKSHKIFRNISSNNYISSLVPQKDIQSTFDKLYHDNEKYKLSKEMKTIDYEYIQGKNNPFTPNIKNNFRKANSKSERNFEERQKEYLYKINKKNEELKNKLDSNYDEICSFNPKITNDKGEYYQISNKEKISSLPVFQRLYDDVKNRKNFKQQKEIENINKFTELSNFLNQKKNVDHNLINKLYENKKEDLINKIREKVEKEQGLTFKPNIEQNEYIKNVNSTFQERNQKWLENRKKNIEEENSKQNENGKNYCGNKEYTKEERKQIVNNIINRLYVNKNHPNKIKNSENVEISNPL